MKKEQQDLAWQCLPKEARDRIRIAYKSDYVSDRGYYPTRGMEVLQKVFGYHNLTSDAEPEEILIVKRNELVDYYSTIKSKVEKQSDAEDYGAGHFDGQLAALDYFFGDKCLPDKEPSVQCEPKFNVGQQVKIILCTHPEYRNKIGIITSIDSCGNPYVKVDGLGTLFHAPYALEPYTEPETKSMQLSNVKDKIDEYFDTHSEEEVLENLERYGAIKTNNDMEEKELNLCELLKDYEGEEFFCLLSGKNAILKNIKHGIVSIQIDDEHCVNLLSDGTAFNGGIPLYIPSRALYEKYPLDAYSAWMEWKSERTPKRWRAKNKEVYWKVDTMFEPISYQETGSVFDNRAFDSGNYFRTEEEAYRASEAIKECLMKFHEQNRI